MKQIHSQEKQQFKKLFKQESIDNIEDRFKVLETFLRTEKHVTAHELFELLNKSGYQVDSDFVKDTLKIMCRFGFAQKNRFDDGMIRYEHLHLGQHRQVHSHISGAVILARCTRLNSVANPTRPTFFTFLLKMVIFEPLPANDQTEECLEVNIGIQDRDVHAHQLLKGQPQTRTTTRQQILRELMGLIIQ